MRRFLWLCLIFAPLVCVGQQTKDTHKERLTVAETVDLQDAHRALRDAEDNMRRVQEAVEREHGETTDQEDAQNPAARTDVDIDLATGEVTVITYEPEPKHL